MVFLVSEVGQLPIAASGWDIATTIFTGVTSAAIVFAILTYFRLTREHRLQYKPLLHTWLSLDGKRKDVREEEYKSTRIITSRKFIDDSNNLPAKEGIKPIPENDRQNKYDRQGTYLYYHIRNVQSSSVDMACDVRIKGSLLVTITDYPEIRPIEHPLDFEIVNINASDTFCTPLVQIYGKYRFEIDFEIEDLQYRPIVGRGKLSDSLGVFKAKYGYPLLARKFEENWLIRRTLRYWPLRVCWLFGITKKVFRMKGYKMEFVHSIIKIRKGEGE